MEIRDVSRGTATIVFRSDEVTFLCNAINETFEALDDWEFETRTGAHVEEMRKLGDELGELARLIRNADA